MTTETTNFEQEAGEITALIGRNIIIQGEYSPKDMTELVQSALMKAYEKGFKDGDSHGFTAAYGVPI